MKRIMLICVSVLVVITMNITEAQTIPYTNVEEGLEIEEIEEELTTFWEDWYKKQDWKEEHILKGIPKIAKYTAEAIHKFQRESVPYNWRDDLTMIPKGRDVHFILGSMAITESSLDPSKIGKLGEAGILQCHPRWCMVQNKKLAKMPYGKRIKTVQENPKLGIELAIRFFSKNIGWCGRPIRKFDDWAYPVSSYSAGTKAFKNGKCRKMKVVKHRIQRAKWYRSVARDKKPLMAKIIFGFNGLFV